MPLLNVSLFKQREKPEKKVTTAVEKAADTFCILIEMLIIQRTANMTAKTRDTHKKEQAAVMGMFHGNVVLFFTLDKLVAEGRVSHKVMVELKALVVEYFAKKSNCREDLSTEEIAQFAKWIYDLQTLIGCNSNITNDAGVRMICDSLCENAFVVKEKSNDKIAKAIISLQVSIIKSIRNLNLYS